MPVRKLVEKYTVAQLQEAEFAIIQEQSLGIQVEGKDQAEKLTNVISAKWILEEMHNSKVDFREAAGEYAKKLRGYQGVRV